MNPPPTVQAVAWAPFLQHKTEQRDVELKIEIKDNIDSPEDGPRAVTRVSGLPAYEWKATPDHHNNIAAYKFTWRGAVTIQTTYPANMPATSFPSAYGRGTGDDVKNGNVTVGFHEWCHQNDTIAYIMKSVDLLSDVQPTPYVLPDSDPPILVPWTYKKFPTFRGQIGQTVAAFRQAIRAFDQERAAWHADLSRFKERCTHEVYYTKRQFEKDHPTESKHRHK